MAVVQFNSVTFIVLTVFENVSTSPVETSQDDKKDDPPKHGGTLVCQMLHTGIHGGSLVQIPARESERICNGRKV